MIHLQCGLRGRSVGAILLVSLAAMMAAAAPLPSQRKPVGDNVTNPAVIQKLDSIVIPEVAFREARVIEIVKFLNAAAKESDPAKVGIPIALFDFGKPGK